MNRNRANRIALAVIISTLAAVATGRADEAAPPPGIGRASLDHPLTLRWDCDGACDPSFADGEVVLHRSRSLWGLASIERPGIATWDPSSAAWYASANGVLVRLAPDGGLEVLADDVQGIDVDVRLSAGRAVSREPDDTIVLHDLAARGGRQVLLAGPGFFHPRFDPAGERVLVHESRAEGGRVWLIDPGRGDARVLVEGYAAAWHPDGGRVVFSRIRDDGERVTGADLWEVDVVTGTERRLAATSHVAEVEAAVSADGDWIIYRDALSDTLRGAGYPGAHGGAR
ncbi:MAG: hypothetical protein ABIK09_16830 [Pseudomonadota bacterium]